MGKNARAPSPVVEVARKIAAALEDIETLTARSSKVDLVSQRELERAAKLLADAEGRHREFIEHFGALAAEVEDMRKRQNASAVALSQHEERLQARRAAYDGLQSRFEHLAEGAASITVALTSAQAEGFAETADAVGRVRDRMMAAVDEARVLTVDAKEEGFTELERRAHAIRQQLASLLTKIDQALPPPSSE